MLVFLLLMMPPAKSQTVLYDNSKEHKMSMADPIDTDQSCIVVTTEHFTQQQANPIKSQMSLSSTHLMKHVIAHFKFLAPITNLLQYSSQTDNYYVHTQFQDSFEYTPLLHEYFPNDTPCIPFLAISFNNSFICKQNQNIQFSVEKCAELIQNITFGMTEDLVQQTPGNITCGGHMAKTCRRCGATPNMCSGFCIFRDGTCQLRTYIDFIKFAFKAFKPSTIYVINHIKYYRLSHIKNFDWTPEPVKFTDINNDQTKCTSYVSDQMTKDVRNIYQGTGVLLYHYERMLTDLFPQPVCQTMKFNVPIKFQSEAYAKYPRALSLFINDHLKIKSSCVFLIHKDSSPTLPSLFHTSLNLFIQPFQLNMNTQFNNSREKRSSTPVINFLFWMVGDTPQRIKTIETNEIRHLVAINRLIKQSANSSKSINSNSQEVTRMFQDLHNDEILVSDLALQINLVKVFQSLHDSYFFHLNKMAQFQSQYNSLLLETKGAIQKDIATIEKCILHKQVCIYRHHRIFCTQNCYLTSDDEFLIHFNLTEFVRINVLHIECLHDKSGSVSQMSNNMFLANQTFFTQIGEETSIPRNCISLNKVNNVKCQQYFLPGPTFLFQCRNGTVFATGNCSYYDPKLTSHQLNYIPAQIPDDHFPIQINKQQYFKNFVCDQLKEFQLPHMKFSSFHQKHKKFLFQKDDDKNIKFHSYFVHNMLDKIKSIEPDEVVQTTTSFKFLFFCIIAVVSFITLLSCCFCPQLLFSFVKSIIQHILMLFSWIASHVFNGAQYLVESTINAYRARQHHASVPNDDALPASPDVLSNQLVENAIQNYCDPSLSTCAPPPQIPVANRILKSIQFQTPDRTMESQSFLTNTIPNAPPLYSGQRTPTRNALFRS